LEDDLAEY